MNSNQYERIEAYLSNRLTSDEKSIFESELAEDKELTAQLAMQQLEHRAMQLSLHEELRKKMSGWDEGKNSSRDMGSSKVIRIKYRRLIGIAAGFLLLIGIGSFWWANQEFSNESLVLANNSYPRISQRSGPTDILTQAQQALELNQPSKALELLESQKGVVVSLISGAANLALEQPELARIAYQNVLNNGSASQIQMAEWQLILLDLQEGHIEKVRPRLVDIINQTPEHSYKNDAIALNTKLDSGWRKLTWR